MTSKKENDSNGRLRAQIRAGRELLDMKQSDLADALGISLSKVSRAESGETKSGDTLLELQQALERSGIKFTPNGVEIAENRLEILEGDGWYLRLLSDVHLTLRDKDKKDAELLFICADDRVSPPAVNEALRKIRHMGVRMRQLVQEGNTYLMGPLEEYRYVPKNRFRNDVSLIYGDKVAICADNHGRALLFKDQGLATTWRNLFDLMWDMLKKPGYSDASEKF